MTTFDLITTTQLAEARGVTRQAILAAVKRGSIVPAQQLSGGGYLFESEAAE